MPTLFEYFGIILKFFSKEHLPIHVHAYYSDKYAMRVELHFKGDKITERVFKSVKGYEVFPPAQMRDLKALVDKYQYQIAEDWITFVIKNKKVKKTVITRKIK